MRLINPEAFVQKSVMSFLAVFLLMTGSALSQYEISWYTIDGGIIGEEH